MAVALRWIRVLHFAGAVGLAAWTLLYTATGWLIVYGPDPQPVSHAARTPVRLATPAPAAGDAQAWSYPESAREQLGIQGRSKRMSLSDAGVMAGGNAAWVFDYERPGEATRIVVAQGANDAQLSRTALAADPTARAFHHLRGLQGGPAYLAWAIAVDVFCFALMGFALTGVLLWHRLRGDRVGWLILLSATTFIAASVIALV